MEAFHISLAKAKKEILLADHLLYVTYSLVKDPKFLMSIVEHTITGVKSALLALMQYERYYKRIDIFPDNFEHHIDIFKHKISKHHNFEDKFNALLRRIRELERYSNDSVMRFKREETYVLAMEDYQFKSLNIDNVKLYCNISKDFIARIEEVIDGKIGKGSGEITLR